MCPTQIAHHSCTQSDGLLLLLLCISIVRTIVGERPTKPFQMTQAWGSPRQTIALCLGQSETHEVAQHVNARLCQSFLCETTSVAQLVKRIGLTTQSSSCLLLRCFPAQSPLPFQSPNYRTVYDETKEKCKICWSEARGYMKRKRERGIEKKRSRSLSR